MGREKQELLWVFFVFLGGIREEQEKRKARASLGLIWSFITHFRLFPGANIVYDFRIIVSLISKVALWKLTIHKMLKHKIFNMSQALHWSLFWRWFMKMQCASLNDSLLQLLADLNSKFYFPDPNLLPMVIPSPKSDAKGVKTLKLKLFALQEVPQACVLLYQDLVLYLKIIANKFYQSLYRHHSHLLPVANIGHIISCCCSWSKPFIRTF